LRKLFADPERVGGGKHERDSLPRLARNRFRGGGGRMARHRAGVAEAEVNVFEAVHIKEMRAVGFGYEDRKFSGPLFHPVHWDAAEKRTLGAFV
jgi:hypothetical protein